MDDSTRILHLLENLLESNSTPETVCADSPELLGPLRERWALCRRIDEKIDALFGDIDQDEIEGDATASDNQTEQQQAVQPQIPGYELLGILGRGGVGVVYRARHLLLNRMVAVKMLIAGPYAGASEREKLLREARAVASLQHPNIVQIFDVGQFEGRPFFSMELVEGKTLAQQIAGAPQNAGDACALLISLASAISVAHAAGIIHQDLKPSNILIARDGTPKITDFGLARLVATDQSMSLEQWGTPSYMAPEHASGGKIDNTTDVYCLGAVFYEMLTGRPPFRGESTSETIRQVISEEPVAPSSFNKPVPRDLETICLKCLEKDRRRRYASASALSAELRRYQRGEPITARRNSPVERAGKWIARHPAVSTAVCSSMLILIAALASIVWLVSQSAARTREVTGALNEAQRLQHQSNWAGTDAALDRAAVRLGDHGTAALQQRLSAIRSDSQLAARLDEITDNVFGSTDGHLNLLKSDGAYQRTFAGAGLAVERRTIQMDSRAIQNSNIQDRLIEALYLWRVVNQAVGDSRPELWELICAADRDPTGVRDQLRSDAVWNSPAAIAEAAKNLQLDHQPVAFCVALGDQLKAFHLDKASFLVRVQLAHPQDFWANFQLGEAMREQGKPQEALRFYQAAIATRPNFALAWHNSAMALAQLNRHPEAITAYRHALEIDPDSFATLFNIAIELFADGKPAAAIEPLKQSLARDPNQVAVLRLLGHAAADVGDIELTDKSYRAAIQLQPHDGQLLSEYRIDLIRQNRSKEALATWAQAIEAEPSNHDNWNGYAEFCLFNGDQEKYRSIRTQLLQRFGDSNDTHICERVGRACLLLPASEEELHTATAMIDRAMMQERARPAGFMRYYKVAKALADIRAGDFPAAENILQGDPMRTLGPAPGLILAIAQAGQGQTDQARTTLAKAVSSYNWKDRSDLTDLWIYTILRNDAEQTVR